MPPVVIRNPVVRDVVRHGVAEIPATGFEQQFPCGVGNRTARIIVPRARQREPSLRPRARQLRKPRKRPLNAFPFFVRGKPRHVLLGEGTGGDFVAVRMGAADALGKGPGHRQRHGERGLHAVSVQIVDEPAAGYRIAPHRPGIGDRRLINTLGTGWHAVVHHHGHGGLARRPHDAGRRHFIRKREIFFPRHGVLRDQAEAGPSAGNRSRM